MTLDHIAKTYDTDKGSNGHFYTPHYESAFGPIKDTVSSVIEVGIGSGASLRMWRDYFPGAMIYGVDQNHQNDLGSHIQCLECEQTDCARLSEWVKDKHLEIIVDDASHDQDKTMITLGCLWPHLVSKGWYAIEDMDRHSFPARIGVWYGQHPAEIRKLMILSNPTGGSDLTLIQKR